MIIEIEYIMLYHFLGEDETNKGAHAMVGGVVGGLALTLIILVTVVIVALKGRQRQTDNEHHRRAHSPHKDVSSEERDDVTKTNRSKIHESCTMDDAQTSGRDQPDLLDPGVGGYLTSQDQGGTRKCVCICVFVFNLFVLNLFPSVL